MVVTELVSVEVSEEIVEVSEDSGEVSEAADISESGPLINYVHPRFALHALDHGVENKPIFWLLIQCVAN